jgi:hypothetical protein
MAQAYGSELKNRRKMLDELYRRVQESESAQKFSAELRSDDFAKIGSSLGLNQTQAIKLFNRLVAEGYVRLFTESLVTRDGVFQGAWVEDLEDKGLIMIGKLPDANERLIAAFEAAIQKIESDPSLDEPEKKRRTELVRRGLDALQNLVVRGAGDYIFGNLPMYLPGPSEALREQPRTPERA